MPVTNIRSKSWYVRDEIGNSGTGTHFGGYGVYQDLVRKPANTDHDLFVAQSNDRIDAGGATGGYVTSYQRHETK
jgi:hypothetical protein